MEKDIGIELVFALKHNIIRMHVMKNGFRAVCLESEKYINLVQYMNLSIHRF